MAELRTKGLIIRSRVYGEADQVVTLFSPGLGKIRALAKNSKKSRKRFMNCLDDYGLVQVEMVRRVDREWDRLDSCRLLARPDLGSDPLRLGLAGLAVEAVDVFCPVGQPDPVVFEALETTLFHLAGADRPLGLGLAFLLRLLFQSGFGPNLEACQKCGQELDSFKGAVLDQQSGALTCLDCAGNHPHISLGGLKTIRLCQQIDPTGLARIRFPIKDEKLIFDLVSLYLSHTAGREMRSLSFLEKMGWRG